MADTMVRYITTTKVVEVYEGLRTRGHKTPEGVPVLETEKTGWFVVLEGNVSLHLGMEKPELSKGDTIKLTLEKQP